MDVNLSEINASQECVKEIMKGLKLHIGCPAFRDYVSLSLRDEGLSRTDEERNALHPVRDRRDHQTSGEKVLACQAKDAGPTQGT